jgi:hypothetical protein
MAAKRQKTNDQILKSYVNEIVKDHPFYSIILRERLASIAEATLASIKKNPSAFDNPVFKHGWYVNWAEDTLKAMDLSK